MHVTVKKSQLAFTERRMTDNIYEKSTVQLASVGLTQARPNYLELFPNCTPALSLGVTLATRLRQHCVSVCCATV